MGIRKSKHARMDIDNLINKINTNHQIEEDTMAIDKQLEKLREAQNILKEANKALKLAAVTLNKAIVALIRLMLVPTILFQAFVKLLWMHKKIQRSG